MKSCLTLDLASSTPTSMSSTLLVLLLFDLEPLRQSSADLKIEKENNNNNNNNDDDDDNNDDDNDSDFRFLLLCTIYKI